MTLNLLKGVKNSVQSKTNKKTLIRETQNLWMCTDSSKNIKKSNKNFSIKRSCITYHASYVACHLSPFLFTSVTCHLYQHQQPQIRTLSLLSPLLFTVSWCAQNPNPKKQKMEKLKNWLNPQKSGLSFEILVINSFTGSVHSMQLW